MKVLIKSIVSALTAASLCTANISAFSANSDMSENDAAVSAADASESDLIRFSGSGVRDGYSYKCTGCSENDEMELIPPSLFKAKWDATSPEYTRTPVFERGKQCQPGQGLNWTMESTVDYEMEFEAEDSFFAGTHISLKGPETDEHYSRTEVYIIDASVNWEVPEDASYIHSRTGNGTLYSVYYCSRMLAGTGKGTLEDTFYIVDRYAEDYGKEGRVSAQHDIGPFLDVDFFSFDLESDSISVGINGGSSNGSAELIRNEITVPDTPKFDDPYDYISKRIYLNNGFHWSHAAQTYADNKNYTAFGYDIEMKGYVGEPIKCTWKYYKGDDKEYSPSEFRRVSFGIPHSFYTLSIIDWQGSNIFDDTDDLVLEYSMDIGSIENKTDESSWNIGANIQCMRVGKDPRSGIGAELLGTESITYVHVIDKTENYELSTYSNRYYAPKELGTITSNGIDYDAVLYKNKDDSAFPSVNLIRREQLAPTEADDVPEGYARYESSFSIVDIVGKLNELGIDIGGVREAEFSFNTYDTSGSAFLNRENVKRIIPENKTFTADDLQLLKDYILGKGNEAPVCEDYLSHDYYQMNLYEYLGRMRKNYDLNDDGEWDIYDLCEMRKRVPLDNTETYVEPDHTVPVSQTYNVVGDGVRLYRGPSESYEAVATLPVGAQIKELGYMNDNSIWFFTEYNGLHGWISTNDAVNPVSYGSPFAFGKPVIYLYPEAETDVHVEIELLTSELSTTYPRYNNGWDVTAYPDGSLVNKADGSHHKYLFWESVNTGTEFDFSKGFCVAGSDTESFLKEKLTYMGLTEEEMNEFIVYWLPKMEHNAYNLITFQGDAYTDCAKLKITPAPDSLLRIFMVYVPLETPADIQPQQLETFERTGFTAVEWGGSEITSF